MTNIKVVIGSNFGDEGKGLFVNKFASDSIQNNKSCIVVMSNGGAQRGHTVDLLNGKAHIFKHFGSGTFEGAHTYFPSQFILNPMEFHKEYLDLVENYKIYPISMFCGDCLWSLPWDAIVNQIIEEHRGEFRHGSCGMGIWETIVRYSKTYFPKISQFVSYNKEFQQEYLRTVRDGYFVHRLEENGINTIPEEWKDIWFNDNLIDNFISDVKFFFSHCEMTNIDFIKNYATIIFENGQGLLLDQNRMNVYGDNTTPSYTGSFNAYNIIKSLNIKDADIELAYISRTYMTRHGAGRFETECDKMILNPIMEDKNNITNPFQGKLRYGELNINGLNQRINEDAEKLKNEFNAKISVGITHTNEYQIDYSKIIADKIYLSDGPTKESVKII